MSREIKKLSFTMQVYADLFLNRCRKEDLDIIIICTDRNREDQEEAYRKKASGARYGESAHNALDRDGNPASEAFDVGVIRNGKYIGRGDDPHYLKAGAIGKEIGLIWAGDWTGRIKETAHFQNPLWKKPAKQVG